MRSRWTRVFAVCLLFVLAAVAPAFGYTKCFNYKIIITTPQEICMQFCTECDYYNAAGEQIGYVDWCNDGGCIPKAN